MAGASGGRHRARGGFAPQVPAGAVRGKGPGTGWRFQALAVGPYFTQANHTSLVVELYSKGPNPVLYPFREQYR